MSEAVERGKELDTWSGRAPSPSSPVPLPLPLRASSWHLLWSFSDSGGNQPSPPTSEWTLPPHLGHESPAQLEFGFLLVRRDKGENTVRGSQEVDPGQGA